MLVFPDAFSDNALQSVHQPFIKIFYCSIPCFLRTGGVLAKVF